jgi:hypothetical protein
LSGGKIDAKNTDCDLIAVCLILADFLLNKPVVLSLSIIPQSSGTVSGTGVYLKGEYVTITADATECFMFIGWYDRENDSLVSADREYTFAIQKSQNLVAKFEKAFLEVNFLLLGSNIAGCKYDVRIKVNERVTKIDFKDRDEISFPKNEVFQMKPDGYNSPSSTLILASRRRQFSPIRGTPGSHIALLALNKNIRIFAVLFIVLEKTLLDEQKIVMDIE